MVGRLSVVKVQGCPSLVPEFPTGQGLQVQHFQPVLYRGSVVHAALHKLCNVGIVDQVVEQIALVQRVVGDSW